jgi:hypothetical protein
MKITREGNRLEIADTQVLFPLFFALFGVGMACAEATKLFDAGKFSLSAAVMVFFGGVFFLVGIALLGRSSFTFDQLQQQMTWKKTGIFGSKSGVVPFAQIRWAYVENDPNQFAAPARGSGSYTRLTLALLEGSMPFSGVYSSNAAAGWERARDAINDFLGRKPGEGPMGTPDDDIRKLVKAGQLVEAIKLVRERLDCSLDEAKQIVDDLKSS